MSELQQVPRKLKLKKKRGFDWTAFTIGAGVAVATIIALVVYGRQKMAARMGPARE